MCLAWLATSKSQQSRSKYNSYAKPVQSAYDKMMSKGHAHTQQDNGRIRAFWVQNYLMCFAKVFIVCCQTIRSVLQNHSMRVAKAFNPRCKTIRSALQNRSMQVSKPFDLCCKTIRSALQNHSICVAKPFNGSLQTIRSATIRSVLPNHSILN